jgi:hypothetical protein
MAGVTGTSAQGCHGRPALHKKTTIRSANGARIEEHVMVHRTDIGGGSMRQASPGNDRMCRRALNDALPRKTIRRPNLCPLLSGGKKCCRLLTTAIPPVLAIDLEPLAL